MNKKVLTIYIGGVILCTEGVSTLKGRVLTK